MEMTQARLNEKIKQVEASGGGYGWPSLRAWHLENSRKAVRFIQVLMAAGVTNIGTTDWNCAPVRVIIGIPHRGKNWLKEYNRFSAYDANNAIKWANKMGLTKERSM